MTKKLDEYKIDEILEEETIKNLGMYGNILKKPIKLVAVGYTLQDTNNTQAEIILKSKDFIEDDEENIELDEDD